MTASSSKRPHSTIPAPILVQTPKEYGQMVRRLRSHSLLAVDTESDSLYRYTPKVCLIQISAYADPLHPDPYKVVDYLVDPLRLARLDELGGMFADPGMEVILHAAENDILMLQRDFDFAFTHIFDTQLSARILGWKRVGLAAILEDQFGVISDKRMQRTDWGRRPLTPKQMAYAQLDTHFLPALRQRQIQILSEAGRWEEAREAFARFKEVEYVEKDQSERSVWQMKRSREVARENTGVLEEVWSWREQTARKVDRPPFKVLSDLALIGLANEQPASMKELAALPGLSQHQTQRFGQELLAAVQRGQTRPLPPLPTSNGRTELQLDPPTQNRFDSLRRWRTKVAKNRGVDPDIVFSNDILLVIAQEVPQTITELEAIPAIGPWKAQTYGPQVLQLL